jgi:predicted transposase YbfD/YdcC
MRAVERKLSLGDWNFRGVWFCCNPNFSRLIISQKVTFYRAVFADTVDFRCTEFRDSVDFRHSIFTSDAWFSSVKFMKEVSFRSATFRGKADFHASATSHEGWQRSDSFCTATQWEKIRGDGAYHRTTFFDAADFRHAVFEDDVLFHAVHFVKDVSFRQATFRAKVDFSFAQFVGYARFIGTQGNHVFENGCIVSLPFVRIERPDRVSFHSVRLQPDWFVNVDVRKFDLAQIYWDSDMRREFLTLRTSQQAATNPHLLLSIADRQLASNAEENHDYRQAAKFRYNSMEFLRWPDRYKDGLKHSFRPEILARLRRGLGLVRSSPLSGAGQFLRATRKFLISEVANRKHRALFTLTWWYWLMSGYGEKTLRATLILLLIVGSFGMLYSWVGPVGRADKNIIRRLSSGTLYSLEVTLLRKPDPPPVLIRQHILVDLETLIGSIQAALLTLAIRRKFMR